MHSHAAAQSTVRLAQDECMAVDMCPCGTIQVHIGALSLRLHPDGFSDLIEVLAIAAAKREIVLAHGLDDNTGEPVTWVVNDERRGKA